MPNCKGEEMATYKVLANYTQQGVEGIKDRPARKEMLRKRCQDNGCELKAGYLAMGRYDHVLLIDAPDDNALARVILGIGMTGNVRTETLRLFDGREAGAIIEGI